MALCAFPDDRPPALLHLLGRRSFENTVNRASLIGWARSLVPLADPQSAKAGTKEPGIPGRSLSARSTVPMETPQIFASSLEVILTRFPLL